MQATEPGGAGQPAMGGDPVETPTRSLFADAGALTRDVRELLHDQLQLAVLEARLAARTMAVVVALAIGLALLLSAAWLSLLGALVMTLVSQGFSAAQALLIMAALSVAVMPVLYAVLYRQVASLGFPASLRTLRPPAADSRAGGSA